MDARRSDLYSGGGGSRVVATLAVQLRLKHDVAVPRDHVNYTPYGKRINIVAGDLVYLVQYTCILAAYPLQHIYPTGSGVFSRAVFYWLGFIYPPLVPVEFVGMGMDGWIDSVGANRAPGNKVTRAEMKLIHPLQRPATIVQWNNIGSRYGDGGKFALTKTGRG